MIRAWQPRPIQQELALCQRYFWKSVALDQAPGTNTSEIGLIENEATTAGTSVFIITVQFAVVMRATPSVRYWDTLGNVSKFTYGGTTNQTGTIDNIMESRCRTYGDNVTSKVGTKFQMTADAEM